MDLERLQRLWREGAADVELLKGLLRALLHEGRWVEAREVAYEAVARREVDVRVAAVTLLSLAKRRMGAPGGMVGMERSLPARAARRSSAATERGLLSPSAVGRREMRWALQCALHCFTSTQRPASAVESRWPT